MRGIRKEKMKIENSSLKKFILLHVCIWIYTGTSICSKFASRYPFLSKNYIIFTMLIFAILAVYAAFWQQIIKHFSASVAYSNKSVTIIWTLIYSAFFFGEGLTKYNIVGAVIIIVGVVMVTGDE